MGVMHVAQPTATCQHGTLVRYFLANCLALYVVPYAMTSKLHERGKPGKKINTSTNQHCLELPILFFLVVFNFHVMNPVIVLLHISCVSITAQRGAAASHVG